MIDIRLVREQFDFVKKAVESKNTSIDFDKLKELDNRRRELLQETESLKSVRNKASKEIGALKKQGKSADSVMAEMKEISGKIAELDSKVKAVEEETHEIMMKIPNLPHSSTPFGKSEKDNVEHKVVDDNRRTFTFKPKDHLTLAESLGIMDFKRASKISGSGFPLYVGKGAILERALINFMLDYHISEGFTEVIPPILALPQSMEGTSQLPKLKDDMYHDEKDDLYLIPTAEVTITNIHREEILTAEELPIRYTGYTPCFRREAGSYGKDTRGLLRVHQFNKVEMVKIVPPDNSYDELEDLVSRVEHILTVLKIPYRVLLLCTGDLSFGAAKCYDIETWSYAEDKYLEASSCSNFEDFQSRRMNLRFRRDANSKPEFCHTLNGSGLATSRLMVSILEHYQNEDGSITVPEALRKYTGFDLID